MMSSGESATRDRLIRRLLKRGRSRAREYLHDPQKLSELYTKAGKKAKAKEDEKGPLAEVWDYLTALLRLIRAYLRHEYTGVPFGSLVLIVAAVVYFVNPFDLVPDGIPLAGYIDDAAVIASVVRQVKVDLDKFRAWEVSRGTMTTN